MKTLIRLSLVPITIMLAGLSGCSSVTTVATTVGSSIEHVAERIVHPFSRAPASKPAPAGLDDYKTRVAQHVVQHNPGQTFSGKLPAMLPAIVVLEITVDENGGLKDVVVRRSRDSDASEVALASMRRSTPLPRPERLALRTGSLTFSETFLFDKDYRFQLRSLAGPQTAD